MYLMRVLWSRYSQLVSGEIDAVEGIALRSGGNPADRQFAISVLKHYESI